MDAFKFEKVVDEMIDQLPEAILKVVYGDLEVVPGKELTPTQVKNQPRVHWDAKPGTYYTLLMTDPDAPSRENPIYGEFKHWIVVNIPGNKIEEGEFKEEYLGSGPPQGTGLHRYIFMVYEQSGKQDFSKLERAKKLEHKVKFNTKSFVKDFSLGKLVAANFYLAQYDDYVPIMQKMLAEHYQA